MEYNKPLISIVTVCYNSEKTIEGTIKSVLGQTYKNYEYLIIDGCSTDDTLKIVREYEPLFKGKMRIISEPDTGIYNAMNKGIKLSQGKIIGLINSDDYYASNTLELVAKKYEEENYPFLVINGDVMRVSESGDEIFRYHFTQEHIDKKQCFGHPSMFAAKAVYDKIGLYDESYKLAADGDWQYRAHEDDEVRYVLCPEVFNHMREGGASDNPKYRWKWFKERSRMKIEHNRSSKAKIYYQEFKSVVRTDIKSIIPKGMQSKMYKLKYEKKKDDVLNIPLWCATIYMLLGAFLFLCGPIRWVNEYDLAFACGLIIIFGAIAALFFGYKTGMKKYYAMPRMLEDKRLKNIEENCLKFLKYAILINLFFTVYNAFEYTGTTNFIEFFEHLFKGIFDPANAYLNKDTSSRAGNIIVALTLVLEPMLSVTRIMSLIYFVRLKMYQKIIVIITYIVEVSRWLAVGTNKGVVDVLVRFLVVFMLFFLFKKDRKKINKKKILIVLGGIALVFLLFFGYTTGSRSGGEYTAKWFAEFPYSLIPESLRLLVQKVDSYLTQGYARMIECLRYCEWKPTFGIGNSRFMMDMFERFFNVDLFARTYPAQLQAVYGIDAFAYWHSSYTWFANDISFVGIIPFMGLVGYFFANISKEAIVDRNPISITLFYFLVLGILNVSCTNYVLAYSNMCVAFWGLVIVRFVQKKYLKVKNKA